MVASCTIDGIDSLLFISNSTIELNADEYDRSLFPVKFQHFGFDRLYDWVQQLENRFSESEIIKILRECTQNIIKAILNNPDALQDLEWRDMERMVSELFRGLGFKVVLTPPAKDGGKDIILELKKNDKKISYIAEIKHWRSRQKVGKTSISNFIKIIAAKKKNRRIIFINIWSIDRCSRKFNKDRATKREI